ncbi:unnamed protein product [Sphagnum compactum]
MNGQGTTTTVYPSLPCLGNGHHVQDVGRKMDGRGIKDAGRGSMNSNSLNIKQQDHLRTDTQLCGSSSSSHHSARVNASSSRANSDQGLVDPEASSSSSEGLHSDVDHHLLRRGSSISGRMLENVTGGVFGKLRSSSYRSSACKRKSCTSSSVSGSLSSTLPSRTLRRSVPMMQHENSGSQRTVLNDCHMNPNERNSSSSSSNSLVPNEILTASSTSTRCQSGSSSLVGGSRTLTESVPPARQSTSTTPSTTGAAPSSRVPHTPCSQRQGNSVHTVLTNNPAISAPGPSRLSPSPPPSSLSPSSSLMAPFVIDSLSSPTSHFRRSLLSRTLSPGGVQESRGFSSAAADSLLGMPFRGLQLSARNGTHPPHLVSEGLAEIISALEHVERDEDLTYEQLLMLEATLLFGGLRLRDQHSDLRLDVDNMSYEELLALEDRIGNVSTGLTAEAVAEKLKRSCYSSLDVVGAQFSQEYDTKCSICQEEYEDGDKLGKIECGHSYHALCIQQWLVQKNQCPICKATAFAH